MDWPTHPRELGLVTTAEAIAPLDAGGLGMTPRAVGWAVSAGRWQRPHRGCW
ncbi:MAG: type IV toxin-antitoxin system AbiEi family antitoxin domain-containing protein [Actinomycetales bacterium]|nr:type IV toxin-antitoxin system AbiEi family antitoxin domain-containing protein [Actinomycetales bacterium]